MQIMGLHDVRDGEAARSERIDIAPAIRHEQLDEFTRSLEIAFLEDARVAEPHHRERFAGSRNRPRVYFQLVVSQGHGRHRRAQHHGARRL